MAALQALGLVSCSGHQPKFQCSNSVCTISREDALLPPPIYSFTKFSPQRNIRTSSDKAHYAYDNAKKQRTRSVDLDSQILCDVLSRSSAVAFIGPSLSESCRENAQTNSPTRRGTRPGGSARAALEQTAKSLSHTKNAQWASVIRHNRLGTILLPP